MQATRRSGHMQSGFRGRIVALAGALALGAALVFATAFLPPSAAPAVAQGAAAGGASVGIGYDVVPRPISLIKPGTVVDRAAPEGWTHLIIKSQPRIRESDLPKVNKMTSDMAALLFTAFVARVDRDPQHGHFKLVDAALGFGTRVNGRDLIITPETQRQYGANLGMIAQQLLKKCCEKQKETRVVVRSPSLMLIDCPAVLAHEGRHLYSILRYALVVDPASGRLDTMVWAIDRDENGQYVKARKYAEWIAPNLLDEARLMVDSNEFFFGIPSDVAFATEGPPAGQVRIEWHPEMLPDAGRPTLETQNAARMDHVLRAMVRHGAQALENAQKTMR